MTTMWGILCGLFMLALWGIHASLTGAGVVFTAWHWVGLFCWLLWSFFGAAVVWTFLYERQARAAGVSAALFGSVSLVIAGILWLVFKGLSA